MTPTRTIVTNPDQLKGHHPDAIRLVVHNDGESWASYLVLDRKKVCAGLRALREELRYRRWYIRPEWYEYYRGPGRDFAHKPHRLHSSRRYIVWCQRGGLDI